MILVRHTTPLVEKGVCYGQTDLPLTSGFLDEAAAIRKQLVGPINGIYASPLQRCLQLANYLRAALVLQAEVSQHAQLMELNFGDWENKPWATLPMHDTSFWMEDFVNRRPPNGESFQELYDRSIAFFEHLALRQPNALLVTHAGVMRCILSHVHHTPLARAFELYPLQYGQVIVL
jgi:alpha-ribazole phosphatase